MGRKRPETGHTRIFFFDLEILDKGTHESSSSQANRSIFAGPGSWLSLCSEPGLRWITEKAGVTDFAISAQKLTAAWNRRWKFGNQGPHIYSNEPDTETAWKYTAAYFDHCVESVYGVAHRPEFEARLQAYLHQGASSLVDDVAWYALRNTVYAAGCRQLLLKDNSSSYGDAQAEAYKFFQNALSVHTDLIYRPSGLESVRALTAMTYYAEAAANEGFEYMMCANAVRLAQAKGLHRKPSKSLNLSEDEVMHRNWLWWAIFCVEKQISFRSGRPSAIDDDNISCEIPDHCPFGSMIDVSFFKHSISMGKTVHQIASRLCSVTAMRQSPLDFVRAANEIGEQIEAWRENIGADFQTPGRPVKADLLRPNLSPLHIIYLQSMYFSTIQSTYAIFAFPWVSSILGIEKDQSFQKELTIKASKVADAARNIILIAKALDLDAALPQWASFYFPMSGLTNLFVFILNFPSLPSAHADVALLDVAAGHFGHMEYLTSSERGLPFTREVANIARLMLQRIRNKPSTDIALPLLDDCGNEEPEVPIIPPVSNLVLFE